MRSSVHTIPGTTIVPYFSAGVTGLTYLAGRTGVSTSFDAATACLRSGAAQQL